MEQELARAFGELGDNVLLLAIIPDQNNNARPFLSAAPQRTRLPPSLLSHVGVAAPHPGDQQGALLAHRHRGATLQGEQVQVASAGLSAPLLAASLVLS